MLARAAVPPSSTSTSIPATAESSTAATASPSAVSSAVVCTRSFSKQRVMAAGRACTVSAGGRRCQPIEASTRPGAR